MVFQQEYVNKSCFPDSHRNTSKKKKKKKRGQIMKEIILIAKNKTPPANYNADYRAHFQVIYNICECPISLTNSCRDIFQ